LTDAIWLPLLCYQLQHNQLYHSPTDSARSTRFGMISVKIIIASMWAAFSASTEEQAITLSANFVTNGAISISWSVASVESLFVSNVEGIAFEIVS
jgi:hypothetical protein